MSSKISTQYRRDARGRRWAVSIVPVAKAADADTRFWKTLSPEARVVAVFAATESALKAQGRKGVPRLRRIARRIERGGR
jgi:hypothetical protein